MTRAELEARLTRAGIAEAREEALRLFCHFAGLSRAMALAEPHADCADDALEAALSRREAGEPLAYILGVACFCNEEYEVSPAVLIPRADTECLVEAARARLSACGRVADLCTGSGCVAISLLAACPRAEADAYDISEDALAVARRNAQRNGVPPHRISFLARDLLSLTREGVFSDLATHGSPETKIFPRAPYDLILSNPPYLSAAEMAALDPSVVREPRAALDGGEDGLLFYRHFLEVFSPLLAEGGQFLFEIGWEQGDALRALGEAHGFSVDIARDLGGRDRVAILRRS